MKKYILFAVLLSFLNFGFGDNPEDKYNGVDKIKSENLISTVKYLSSPELAGRLGGSEGYYKAADFIANEFKSLGLKPIGDKGYFQNFKVEYNDITGPCNFGLSDESGIVKKYILGNDYVCRGFTGSGKFNT